MAKAEPRAMIELRGVTLRFGDQTVLRDLDLKVEEGETFVLMGGSGSGKTVLIKLVCGLLRPNEGEVWVDGKNLATLSDDALDDVRRELGIMFQAGALFDSLTVRENLAFVLRERMHLSHDERQERVTRALKLLQLEDAGGLTTAEISGGMRKRVAFARALVLEPKILLFDEPTAGLDPLTTLLVSEEIELAHKELHSTILAITHDLPTGFRIADRMGLLVKGKIVGQQPPEAFGKNTDPDIERFLHTWHEQGH